jgi:hypothetical protein
VLEKIPPTQFEAKALPKMAELLAAAEKGSGK